MDISAALPIFVVTLREGFEAALVVGIVLACLQKAQKMQLVRWVYIGIISGILASILLGLLLGGILQQLEYSDDLYAPVLKEGLKAGFGIVAIIMLSWMLIWMTNQAKTMKTEVEDSIQTALKEENNANLGIWILVFIAVIREGFETVLFIVAKFQQGWLIPSIGAISGLGCAAGIGVLLFKWGIKINIRRFFQIMGVFLLLIVGGLVISALKHLDGAIVLLSQIDSHYAMLCFTQGKSCLLGIQIWDTSTFLPDREFPGIILKSLFGYRQTLYLVQLCAYILFIGIVGGTYFQSLKLHR
jgi:high-affinity iron transporter